MTQTMFGRRGLVAAGLLAAPAVAWGQAAPWPSRPIRIVVPFAAGGNTDAIARLTAEMLSEVLGVPAVVENRAGAGGLIAAEAVSRAAPDGYTLLMAAVAVLAVAPAAASGPPRFDPVADFTPIALLATNPFVLVVHRSVPATTLAEYVALGRGQSGRVAYATGGVGSMGHLTTLLFLERAGFEATHVPYRGGGPAMTDVLAGQVPSYFANLSEALPHARNPDVRLLAVSGATRAPQLPDVPTVAEQGFAGFSTITWNGLVGPARMPPEAVARINAAVAQRAADPRVQARFLAIGVELAPTTPAAFGQNIAEDVATYRTLIRTSNITID
ncbi:Bug family tripartite tricarboxylate transporter substrate binding protein [Humitalea sp. 24SJ18S-53]|uniref:Bug family tripartite tricarboxylate transporter substrate binding protein n=1 Tax=Humitalea sp. 24SJ18S-53 TaxID=3422307 RepID=UPI003D67D6D8